MSIQTASSSTFYRRKLTNSSSVPSGYQEVEYIESTGRQIIETGITVTTPFTLVGSLYVSDVLYRYPGLDVGTRDRNGYVRAVQCFANYSTDYAEVITFVVGSSHYIYHCTQIPSVPRDSTMTPKILDYKINFSLNCSSSGSTLVANGATSTSATSVNFTSDNNLTLYMPMEEGVGRFYELKYYSGSTLAGDFVPCYRKSDNVGGVYDTVGGCFITNSSDYSLSDYPFILGSKVD